MKNSANGFLIGSSLEWIYNQKGWIFLFNWGHGAEWTYFPVKSDLRVLDCVTLVFSLIPAVNICSYLYIKIKRNVRDCE